MPQTILSMVAEIEPASTQLLIKLIRDFRNDCEKSTPQYGAFKQAVPLLHFMSMTVFTDDLFDPIFVIEANFDGKPGPFWAQLEAAIDPGLRNMLRCCKPPRDGTETMFQAMTASGSHAPVAPYLEARTVAPAVAHQGNRGMDRHRIEAESALFLASRDELDTGHAYRGLSATEIHANLRAALLPRFAWLDEPPPAPRISQTENLADWAKLIGFGLLAVAALWLPGLMLASLLPPWLVAAAAVTITAICVMAIGRDAGAAIAARLRGPAMFYGIAMLGLAIWSFHVWRHGHSHGTPWLAGLGFIVPILLSVVVWLRALERRDPPQDAPSRDEAELRRIARSEDHVVQNHMGSVVHIKPGVLRAVLIRAGLLVLGLVLRLVARDGYLGSMRTIHFAHWGITGGGGRLMFFSNFDGSWESYLDDFIEKAHAGLTLAWTCCIGFPPTRYLVFDGATQGRKFKAWARHSMAESLFWFSGYDTLSVNQIERQAAVADGLRKTRIENEEAKTWASRL